MRLKISIAYDFQLDYGAFTAGNTYRIEEDVEICKGRALAERLKRFGAKIQDDYEIEFVDIIQQCSEIMTYYILWFELDCPIDGNESDNNKLTSFLADFFNLPVEDVSFSRTSGRFDFPEDILDELEDDERDELSVSLMPDLFQIEIPAK